MQKFGFTKKYSESKSISFRKFATWLLAIGVMIFSLHGFIWRPIPVDLAQAAVSPELPRVYLDTAYPTFPAGHVIRLVKSSCTGIASCYTSLQSAIDQANLGDEIVIDANLSITGPVKLKNKTAGSGWIVIRTSDLGSLPLPGTRVGPGNAGAMPKIEAPGNGVEALLTEDRAHHYRLVGIEFREKTPNDDNNVLVQLGNGNSQCATTAEPYKVCDTSVLTTYANNIVLDRVYVHGHKDFNTKRGIGLDSIASAVIDSYVSDIHVVGFDNQAIGGFNGPGPYKIVNNYLEGAAENIIFGGDDPRVQNLIPSDIEIRNNYFYKPLSWRYGDSTYNNRRWQVKNLLELKNARRVLIDGNIFENNWAEAQAGRSILFNTTNQYGRCPWCEVSDVTFTNNIVRHVAGGISVQANDYNHLDFSTGVTRRIKISNNLIYDNSGKIWGDLRRSVSGPGDVLQLRATDKIGAYDVEFSHNTVINDGKVIDAGNCMDKTTSNDCSGSTAEANRFFAIKPGFNFSNNIVIHNSSGVMGDMTSIGNQTLSTYMPNGMFVKNILVGQRSSTDTRNWSGVYSSYPDNFFPKSLADIGFVDLARNDYRLAATLLSGTANPYKNAGTDGKDLGTDIEAVNRATAGVVLGVYGVTINPPPPTTSPDKTAPLIPAFDIQPRNTASTITGSFTVTDSGGSFLANAEILRAPAKATNCIPTNISGCSWTHILNLTAPPGLNVWSGNFSDNPGTASYLYGIHAFDNAGNKGFEPFILQVNGGTVTFSRTISILSLEGRASRDLTGSLDVLSADKTPIKSYTLTTGSTGQTQVTFDISPTTGYLRLRAAPFLAKIIPVDLSSTATYSFPQLLTGDINQDNIINSIDFSSMNAKWFSTDSLTDLNQDKLVNSLDFSLLNTHWFANGDK